MFKKILFHFFLFFSLQMVYLHSNAQQKNDTTFIYPAKDADTTGKNILASDTSLVKKHSPKIASFRSAILPGWGQAYNKKYWKIPIIYGALGTTAAVFAYNLKTYKQLRQAYIYLSDTIPSNDALINPDFVNLSPESIRSYRGTFRQNVDYSVLFFIFFWGLNIVDATVDAHLKSFDVSNDITLKVKPFFHLSTTGISLVFSFKDNHSKTLSSLH
ncbi:MAG: DUF5683 domain-containing protein [Ginsengibacter sp.]